MHKKSWIKLLYALMVFLVPWYLFAHGGVEKHTDNVLVFLKQSPLSPIVGEEVTFAFAFSDINSGLPLKNLAVSLALIDTYPGDESKDTEVLSQDLMTDVNGDFEFRYTFTKENYFDIDLDFTNPSTSKSGEVGFLVEPRSAPVAQTPQEERIKIIIAAIIGFVVGTTGLWFKMKKSKI